MIYRGSLKRCLASVIYNFNNAGHQMLSIIHCDRGKYYTVLSEDQLLDYNNRKKSDDMRLLFRGTQRELAQFASIIPPQLFNDKENHEGS